MRPTPQVLVTTLLCFLSGCRGSAYDAASRADSADGWRAFLRQHPRDDNADAARGRLSDLEFARAQKVHSVVAYKRYLEEFPDSDKAPAARALLEGLRFNAAQDKRTANALRQFLRDHPDGAHREEAEALLSKLELDELVTVDDPRKLAELAARHADDPRGEAVAARVDDSTWAEATSAARLFAYLRAFPAGAHRDQAKARLLSRQLDGLLVSGLIEPAKALADKSPLAAALDDLKARFARAEAQRAWAASRDERQRRALASSYLRDQAELVRSLQAPDPLDRWDAAVELGQFSSVAVLDPLLEVFRTGRSPALRRRAFDSLGRVLKALPRDVAEYEVAVRVDALAERASDAQLVVSVAALLDLSGQLEVASGEYRRAWDPNAPDPVVLARWAAIRRERGQLFSAAVTARQLSTWAGEVARGVPPLGPHNARAQARELCGAAEAAREALAVIEAARAAKTEFPDDVEVFALRAREAVRLAEAKLRDAELVMLEQDPGTRRCGDGALEERLTAGEDSRLLALEELQARPPRNLDGLLAYIRGTDPSGRVRAAATRSR